MVRYPGPTRAAKLWSKWGQGLGAFFADDTNRGEVVFRSDKTDHTPYRNVMIDAKGRAYIAREDGGLLVYEPGANQLVALDEELPHHGLLRASTRPAPDGTIYGVTQGEGDQPDRRHDLFAFSPDRGVRDLGEARGYTASVASTVTGRASTTSPEPTVTRRRREHR